MRMQFNCLRRGSDAYNRDTEDIKCLVSILVGVLKKHINELPKGFSFTSDLYQENADCPVWSIRITLWAPKSKPWGRDIDVVLYTVAGNASMKVPWYQVKWTPFGTDMPLGIAKEIANNLDALIGSALDALEQASLQHVSDVIVGMIARGRVEQDHG